MEQMLNAPMQLKWGDDGCLAIGEGTMQLWNTSVLQVKIILRLFYF